MTTPAAPGAPEGTQQGNEAPGAPSQPEPQQQTAPATQPQQTAPGAQPLGKPNSQQQPSAPEPKTEGQPETQDVSQLPAWAQKQIKDLRNEAAKARTGAKQTAAEEARKELLAEFAKSLGLTPEGEPTADELNTQLQEQIAGYEAQIEELQAGQTEAAFQGYIRDAAQTLGLDASMLAGWQNFRDEVEHELSDEFTDEDLKAAVEKVAKTYQGRPQFAAANGAAQRSGAPMPGAPRQQPARARSLNEAIKRSYGG